MNIKSNKENKRGFNFSWKNLVGINSYLAIPIITLLIVIPLTLMESSWVAIMIWSVLGAGAQFIFVGMNEDIRRGNARYYENGKYGLDKPNWFGMILIPVFLIGISYFGGIKPMIHDYKTEERIDKILPMEVNTTLFYNDNNNAFILFVEGQKHPLMIDKSGSTETYNRLKADYLDKKIEVVKKEIKGWTDEKSSISYTLDGYSFN